MPLFFILFHDIIKTKLGQKEVVVNMAHSNQNWDSLGRDIQNVVDQAVNSRDYQQLNQTVRQVVGQIVDTGSEAIQKILDSTGHQKGKNLYSRTTGKMVKAVLQYFIGIPLAIFTFLALLGGTIAEEPVRDYPGAAVFLLIFLAIGIWLINSGANTEKMVKRFKVYKRALGQKTYCSVDILACSVGKNKEFVQKDLRQMISKGFFLEGHLDKEGNRDGYLIVKPAKDGDFFLGCSNYKKDGTGCGRSLSKKQYYDMLDLDPDPIPQPDAMRDNQRQRAANQTTVKSDPQPTRGEVIEKADTKVFTYEESNLNDTVFTILQCLSNVSAKRYYGISVLTDILRGANSQKIKSAELDRIPEYGTLKHIRREILVNIIDWLIEQKFILKTKGTYPVLHPTYDGMHYAETMTNAKLKKLQVYLMEQSS